MVVACSLLDEPNEIIKCLVSHCFTRECIGLQVCKKNIFFLLFFSIFIYLFIFQTKNLLMKLTKTGRKEIYFLESRIKTAVR